MRANLFSAVAICVCLAAPFFGGCAARKGQAGADTMASTSTEVGENATLQAELGQRNQEVTDMRAEIAQLRQHEDDLTQRLKQALRNSPGKTISDHPQRGEPAQPAQEASIKELQDELRRERQKRMQLEQQLARLKAETSSPPFPAAAAVPAAKPVEPVAESHPAEVALPVPKPLAESDLASEPPAPAPLHVEAPPPHVEAPPAQIEPPPPRHDLARDAVPSSDVAAEVAALRTRGIEQESQHQEAMASLSQVLDADRKRQEDLEAQIIALRTGAPGTEGAVAADSNEVRHLQTRLEEERHKNAELTAKLKLAGRVTDLVFRMQNQANPQAAPPRNPQVSQQDNFGPAGPGPNAPNQPYTNEEGNVHQPSGPRVPNVRPRDAGNPDQAEVPQIEQPPVFPDGPVQTEETTQD